MSTRKTTSQEVIAAIDRDDAGEIEMLLNGRAATFRVSEEHRTNFFVWDSWVDEMVERWTTVTSKKTAIACAAGKPAPHVVAKILEMLGREEADIRAHLSILGECSEEVHQCTALHWACSVGSLEIVRSLVKAGAPLDSRDGFGRIPLHGAVSGDFVQVVRFLLDLGDNSCTASTRVAHRHESVVAYRGQSSRTVIIVDRAPIHLAKSAAMVRLLVEKGADVNSVQGEERKTALQEAGGNQDLAAALIEAGAKPV